eukprot:PhM_4_TR18624/c0_g2_i1/m.27277
MSGDNLIDLLHAMEDLDEPCALCTLANEVRQEAQSHDDLRNVFMKKASQCTAEEIDITAQLDLKAHARERLQFELKKMELAIGELEKKRKVIRNKRVLIQTAISKLQEGTFGQYLPAGSASVMDTQYPTQAGTMPVTQTPTTQAVIAPRATSPPTPTEGSVEARNTQQPPFPDVHKQQQQQQQHEQPSNSPN